jgi:hypothetical protein
VIIEPTVFILGAGASLAYGFPSGPDLVQDVCVELAPQYVDRVNAICACGPSAEHVERFRRDLFNSARTSIDAFIESRGDEYDLVGRLAIAQRLLRSEEDRRLNAGDDWYRAFFDAILGTSVEQFRRNSLKIITFNFDRSLERKLFLALSANYGNENAVTLIEHIPILHIHGQLGLPEWIPAWKGGPSRAYEPSEDPAVIRQCADQIRIVHHAVTDVVLHTAQTWIREAARVSFLGFSYHELNLKKLGMPQVRRGLSACDGTAYRMDPGPLSGVKLLVDGTVNLRNVNILDYIRSEPFLYQ